MNKMARVTARVRTELGIKVWTVATIYVASEVMRIFTTILEQRKLNLTTLLIQKEAISNGLFTWITTRHLKAAILEIYHQDNPSMAIERWDLVFRYEEPREDFYEDETGGQFRTYLDEIYELLGRLEALPEGSEYRLILNLHANAPSVDGWQLTNLKDVSHLEGHHVGERDVIETPLITVGMEYRGKTYRGLDISRIPGGYENRVFIGGNYDLMVNLKEIKKYVRENGFQPILAYDFNVPRDRIHDYDLLLLHNCKYAIFDVTYPAGELMEIERTRDYGTIVLIVYQIRDPEHLEPPSQITSMVTTSGYPMRGYSSFDELREIITEWFTDIEGGRM